MAKLTKKQKSLAEKVDAELVELKAALAAKTN